MSPTAPPLPAAPEAPARRDAAAPVPWLRYAALGAVSLLMLYPLM